MFKRYRANYSLWPEQARPRRGRPLRVAIGSFALGVVCAAAYGVVFGFSGPVAAGQESAARSVVEHGPVYASVAPPVTPAPARIETEYRSRPRAPAAKTRLPIIGSQPVLITADDDSGGDKLAGEAPAADVAASSGNPSTAKRDESEFAREVPLPEARPERSPPAGVTERRAKSRKTIVEKKRERPAKYAAKKNRQKREEPARRAARRQDSSPSITEVALQALHAFTGGQGMIGWQGDGF